MSKQAPIRHGEKRTERVTKCRRCEKPIEFSTDGNGRLVALNPDGTRHGCKDA